MTASTETARTEDDRIEDVRLCIYASLATTGALPPIERLAEIAGGPAPLAEAIASLAARRHVVLDASGAIAMAHPFATRSFGFSVMSATTLWWGGCAWDSFAIPHVIASAGASAGASAAASACASAASAGDVLVATRCPTCDRALAWVVGRDAPPVGAEVAHFLVPVARMWNDVLHTCANQRLFCGDACIDRWLAARGEAEGTRLSLDRLWNLAAHWYDGRLARGYTRRPAAEAAAYFRSVGLDDPFWSV